MKKITAIVRPEKLEPLKEALFAAQVSGMTISQVQGCGKQHGWKEYYRGTEVMLNMIPKVKFELVVDDGEVGPLVDLIRATARTGEVGDRQDIRLPRGRRRAHPHRGNRRGCPCRRCGADRPYVAMRDGSVGAACWPPVASRRLRAGIPFTAVVFVIPRSRTGRFWRAHRKRRQSAESGRFVDVRGNAAAVRDVCLSFPY